MASCARSREERLEQFIKKHEGEQWRSCEIAKELNIDKGYVIRALNIIFNQEKEQVCDPDGRKITYYTLGSQNDKVG